MIVFWALWSVLAWPLVFSGLMVLWCVCFVGSRFAPFHRWQHRWPARSLGLVPHLFGCRYRLHYHPDFDPKRPSVYCQNHASMLDGLVALRAIPAPFCGVENVAHFRLPGYGWLMHLGGGIRVPQQPGGRLAGIIEQARQRVGLGLGILTFPEGGRTLDGRLRPFHRGAFFLARELGLPIVPVGVIGLRRVLPKGSWVLRPAPVIEVYVGPQVEVQGLNDAQVAEFTEGVRQLLRAYVQRREMRAKPAPAPWQVPAPSPAGLSAHGPPPGQPERAS